MTSMSEIQTSLGRHLDKKLASAATLFEASMCFRDHRQRKHSVLQQDLASLNPSHQSCRTLLQFCPLQ